MYIPSLASPVTLFAGSAWIISASSTGGTSINATIEVAAVTSCWSSAGTCATLELGAKYWISRPYWPATTRPWLFKKLAFKVIVYPTEVLLILLQLDWYEFPGNCVRAEPLGIGYALDDKQLTNHVAGVGPVVEAENQFGYTTSFEGFVVITWVNTSATSLFMVLLWIAAGLGTRAIVWLNASGKLITNNVQVVGGLDNSANIGGIARFHWSLLKYWAVVAPGPSGMA